jgi:hypothetical protein
LLKLKTYKSKKGCGNDWPLYGRKIIFRQIQSTQIFDDNCKLCNKLSLPNVLQMFKKIFAKKAES